MRPENTKKEKAEVAVITFVNQLQMKQKKAALKIVREETKR